MYQWEFFFIMLSVLYSRSYNLLKKGTGKDSWSVGEKQTLMTLATSLPDCCTKVVFPVLYAEDYSTVIETLAIDDN